jgi:methylenetetrahydrofolate dehydrogenase (NADP+)/methenyltetrahydrofolate cyclohydrolase
VVVGRSNSVGKPAQMLGLQRNATVIACHSRTKPLEDYTRQADILIVAAGVRGIVDGAMVKEGVVAVDVGIHAVKDEQTGKTGMVGDLIRQRGRAAEAIIWSPRRRSDHDVWLRQRPDGRDRPPGGAPLRALPLALAALRSADDGVFHPDPSRELLLR